MKYQIVRFYTGELHCDIVVSFDNMSEAEENFKGNCLETNKDHSCNSYYCLIPDDNG